MAVIGFCLCASPVQAEQWHEYGNCLHAKQTVRVLFSQIQGLEKVKEERCVKDVRGGRDSFDVRLRWSSGEGMRITAQNRRDGLQMYMDHRPVIASVVPILGYKECYSLSIPNGFEHYCFKGNGLIVDGEATK